MKYLISAGILAIIVLGVIVSFGKSDNRNKEEIQMNIPIPTVFQNKPAAQIMISYQGIEYNFYYFPLSGKTIKLIPNFTQQTGANTLATQHICESASSGGFYTKEDTPLGLFKVDGEILQQERKETNLVNGFFYLDEAGNPAINSFYMESANTILQTGPYMPSRQPLSIMNDKQARRIVVFETTTGAYYIGALTAKDLFTSGPFLSQVPPILFSITDPFSITKALNLDGGAASFYTDKNGFTLSELTHVGSVICVR